MTWAPARSQVPSWNKINRRSRRKCEVWRYGMRTAGRQRGSDIIFRWRASSAAMHRFLPAPELNTSHVYMQGALCPAGKYTVRPDCTVISTTHQVTLGSAGKIKLLIVELVLTFLFFYLNAVHCLTVARCFKGALLCFSICFPPFPFA